MSSYPLSLDPASGPVFSHHVDPARLLQLAIDLFGQSPPAVQVSIRVADVGPGTELSPTVDAAMPTLVGTVIDVINEHCHADA